MAPTNASAKPLRRSQRERHEVERLAPTFNAHAKKAGRKIATVNVGDTSTYLDQAPVFTSIPLQGRVKKEQEIKAARKARVRELSKKNPTVIESVSRESKPAKVGCNLTSFITPFSNFVLFLRSDFSQEASRQGRYFRSC